MLAIGFRSTLEDFLTDACFYYDYDRDSPEVDGYIHFYRSLDDEYFRTVVRRALNIEIEFRSRTDDEDVEEYDLLYGELMDELANVGSKGIQKYPGFLSDLPDFSYVLLEHLTDWAIELQGTECYVEAFDKFGDRMDVTVS